MTNDELAAIFDASAYPDVFDALSYVADQHVVEFEPQVRALLVDQEETVRAFAVEVLSTEWKLPSFRDECEAIATSDPATLVRQAALSGLIGYGTNTADTALAELLWNLLHDADRPTQERALALDGLPQVLEGDAAASYFREAAAYARDSPMSEQDFLKLVPWDTLQALVAKHSLVV